MIDPKKIKIEFAPGCFDNFDGTQEELDEIMAEIIRMAESGEIEENSKRLSEEDLADIPPEMLEKLLSDNEPKRNLQ
jgi:hypothetical protein